MFLCKHTSTRWIDTAKIIARPGLYRSLLDSKAHWFVVILESPALRVRERLHTMVVINNGRRCHTGGVGILKSGEDLKTSVCYRNV